MITGRKIADGSNGKGETPVRKTPLMAAVQAIAAQQRAMSFWQGMA